MDGQDLVNHSALSVMQGKGSSPWKVCLGSSARQELILGVSTDSNLYPYTARIYIQCCVQPCVIVICSTAMIQYLQKCRASFSISKRGQKDTTETRHKAVTTSPASTVHSYRNSVVPHPSNTRFCGNEVMSGPSISLTRETRTIRSGSRMSRLHGAR